MIHSIYHMSYVTYNLSIICELHIPYVICLHVFLFLSATTLQQHCAHTGTKTCVQLLAAGTKTCVQLLACMPTQYIKHQTWHSNYKSYANSILQQTWYACIFHLFWGLKQLFVYKQLFQTPKLFVYKTVCIQNCLFQTPNCNNFVWNNCMYTGTERCFQLLAFMLIPMLQKPKNSFEVYSASDNYDARIPSVARQLRVQPMAIELPQSQVSGSLPGAPPPVMCVLMYRYRYIHVHTYNIYEYISQSQVSGSLPGAPPPVLCVCVYIYIYMYTDR